ncbi:MAG: nucleoside triphosphate pyrophosphohydrolase [Gammaproteobacteria bacterium]
MTKPHEIADLLSLMDNLRDKELGCNWDKKQTLKTLTGYTLEEVYEVIDAVDTNDDAQLQDELGDLLFQVVFYAQIAKEEGRFDFNDVIGSITDKLLRRHPHVFPDGSLASFGNSDLHLNADEVASRWEQIKNEERALKAQRKGDVSGHSVLDDVPNSLPALDRARKLQKRAASVGFDWTSVQPVLDKLKEEIAELEAELLLNDTKKIHEEFGDLMFSCVNVARHLQLDPESVLRESNRKFERRFRAVEGIAIGHGRTLESFSEEELDRMWTQVKAQE